MMKTYIQVNLGGQLRGLKFNLGTLRHIGDITGNDPFKFIVNVSEYDPFMKDFRVIVYAGLLSNYDSMKREPEFTQEEVRVWVDEIDNMREALRIVNAFSEAYKTESVSGEGDEDTQQVPATKVA